VINVGRYVLSAVALAACYNPTIQLGGVCTPPNGICPEGQSCSAAGVCTSSISDAAGQDAARHSDAEPDASNPGGDDGGTLPAWRLVQAQSLTAPLGGSASVTATLTSTMPGDLLVVGIQTAPGATITNVSDNASGGTSVFTAITGSMASNSAGDGGLVVWYTPSVNAGATSVTATTSDAIYGLVVWELATAQPATVDAVKALSNQAASTAPTSPSIAAEHAGELVIAIAISAGTITSIQAGNEFTNDAKPNGNGFAHITSTTAAAGPHQAAWDSNSATYCSTAVAFHVGE
jgi:hypothetical protein